MLEVFVNDCASKGDVALLRRCWRNGDIGLKAKNKDGDDLFLLAVRAKAPLRFIRFLVNDLHFRLFSDEKSHVVVAVQGVCADDEEYKKAVLDLLDEVFSNSENVWKIGEVDRLHVSEATRNGLA